MSVANGTQKEPIGKSSDLRHEAELFINAVPCILISLDWQGQITRWNHFAAEVFGLNEADVLGKSMAGCGIKWLTANVEPKINRALQSDSRTTIDDATFEKGGKPRLLGLNVIPILLSPHKHTEFLVMGTDITDRRRSEEELRAKTAFLEAQIRATIDGILVVDENGSVVWHNRRFLEIFEVPPQVSSTRDDNLLLQVVQQKVEDPEGFLKKVRYLYFHKHETSRDEIRFRDGTVLDRYSSPVFGNDDHYYGRIWTFRDITQRQKSEEALRQLSAAVEQSPVSVVITDLKGNITYVNRRFTECTGYSSQEVLGKSPRILKSEHTSADEYRRLWDTITRGEEWRGELRNKKKSGELYWESIVISPIRNNAGEISHYLAVKEDITEQKFNESHARQAQKLEAIGQLAAGIAHEINTPIQFIGDNTRFIKEAWSSLDAVISQLDTTPEAGGSVSQLQQLRDGLKSCDHEYLRAEVPRALDQSLDGIGRVARIVQAMKEFSHPGTDEKQPADINKAILTTLTVSRNEWKYVAEVETILQPDMELVPCHIGELNQVVLNLLINSAHAIGEVVRVGSETKGKITLRTAQDEQYTTISVEDTGGGIPPAIQSKVFDPFFTTKGVGRGTGQGLSLAHNSIVNKHGGKIWFESEVGKGTTFFIQLPTKEGGTG